MLRVRPPAIEALWERVTAPKVTRVAANAGVVPALPTTRNAALASTSQRLVYAPIDAVGRSHQIDNLIQTNWDTTRCSAASAVAMSALAGKSYLVKLAVHTTGELERRMEALWGLVEKLDNPNQRDAALREFLPELQRHMNAFRLSFSTAAAELHYKPSKTPTGVGLPASAGESSLVANGTAIRAPSLESSELHVAPAKADDIVHHWYMRDDVDVKRVSVPATSVTVPWSRIIGEGAEARVALQTKTLEIAAAAQMLAFYQLTGDELELLDRMISCLGGEIEKARATRDALKVAKGDPDPQLLQQLADSVLVAQQHSGRGLNACETGEALKACGLHVESTGRPIPWSEQARHVAPGESLLLEGSGHAITFGRLATGQTFIYDSEGILGEHNAKCVLLARPGESAELDNHYGAFQATHRVRPPRASMLAATH